MDPTHHYVLKKKVRCLIGLRRKIDTMMFGQLTTFTLESLGILLTNNRQHESLGTCRTEFKVISFERTMNPFPAIGDKLPSAILTFKWPEQGSMM